MFLGFLGLIEAGLVEELSWIKSYIIQRTFAHVMVLMSLPFLLLRLSTSVLAFFSFSTGPGIRGAPILTSRHRS